jgi:hypothetical protein
MITRMSKSCITCGCSSKSTMGQRMAVALVALGLGSVIFGLVGFRKHQRDADEIDRLARQYGSHAEMLGPDVVNPSERMARWNLLVWTGVGFSYFGVSIGVASAMHNRIKQAKAKATTVTAATELTAA